MTNSSDVKKHAEFGPSKAHRLVPCPGSLAFCADMPDKSSADADLGTRAHKAAELLLNGTPFNAAFVSEYGYEMSQAVRSYADFIGTRQGTLMVEVELPLDRITGEEGAVGTADSVIVGEDYIEVHDYKHGVGVKVYADGNPQLEMYGLAALDKFGSLFGPFKEVRMFIHQPRLGHVDHVAISAEALYAKRYTFWDAAHLARALKAEGNAAMTRKHLHPGEKQCKFCPGKSVCPELAEYVRVTVGEKFDDLTAEAIDNPVGTLDQDDIATKFGKIALVRLWCNAIEEEAKALANAGLLPGYKMVVSKGGARQWSSAEEAEAAFKSMRLKAEEMYDMKLISPTVAEKLLKSTPKRWKRVEHLIVRGTSSKSLVPLSDPRPAVTPVPEAFEDLTHGGLL